MKKAEISVVSSVLVPRYKFENPFFWRGGGGWFFFGFHLYCAKFFVLNFLLKCSCGWAFYECPRANRIFGEKVFQTS